MPIDRRNFLKNGALATAGAAVGRGLLAAGTLEAFLTGASAMTGEKVIVVVNLMGGNDGLNTVVPVQPSEYNEYRALRPRLRYDLSELLSLTGEPDFMLNPEMGAFQSLFDQGRLAIINGVGVPETAVGLFDHSTGQYEFQTCDIVKDVTSGPPTGWLGRYLDGVSPGQVSPGINLGGGRLMLTGSQKLPISIRTVDRFQLQVSGVDRNDRRTSWETVQSIPATGSPVAELNRQYREQANTESQIIRSATSAYVPSVTYPDTQLGRQLIEAAKIIWGDVGVRALAVRRSGFDTHGSQNQAKKGNLGFHDSLLQDVSESISAFYTDLVNQGLSSRVLILTISEFGRRAYENGDKGTDHGLSSVGFAIGDGVNGGIYGTYPSVHDLVKRGNLRTTTDFRSVYSSVISGWFNEDPVPIVGGSFPTVPFV